YKTDPTVNDLAKATLTCSNGQVAKWNTAPSAWKCADDVEGSVGADSDWIISGDDMYSGVSGNVGIGTMSPGSKVSIAGGATVGSSYAIYTLDDRDMAISGDVGIGTNTIRAISEKHHYERVLVSRHL
ncbi:MAG: hypothetical protein ACMUIP_17790, partial [bacterium]